MEQCTDYSENLEINFEGTGRVGSGIVSHPQHFKPIFLKYVLANSLLFDLRCNNVLYVRGVDEEEEDGEMRE